MIRTGWIVTLGLAACAAALPARKHSPRAQTKADVQLSASEDKFKCDQGNSTLQVLKGASNKHIVILSWKASVSLSTPPAKGDGYNLYRFDLDEHSCTKINKDPIPDTSTKDGFAELGKTYQYAARALKQNRESKPSNVVELTIPPK